MAIRFLPSLAEMIIDLQAQGYEMDFSLVNNQLYCVQEKILLFSQECHIREMHYFPPGNHLRCEKMLYAIDDIYYGIKGLLLLTGNFRNDLFPEIILRRIEEDIIKRRPGKHHLVSY